MLFRSGYGVTSRIGKPYIDLTSSYLQQKARSNPMVLRPDRGGFIAFEMKIRVGGGVSLRKRLFLVDPISGNLGLDLPFLKEINVGS